MTDLRPAADLEFWTGSTAPARYALGTERDGKLVLCGLFVKTSNLGSVLEEWQVMPELGDVSNLVKDKEQWVY